MIFLLKLKFKTICLVFFVMLFVCMAKTSFCGQLKSQLIPSNEKPEIPAIEKKDIDIITKQNIVEADEYFNKASEASSQGDHAAVAENYHKFLKKLNSVDVDPSMSEYLLTDCENILAKIKNIHNIDANRTHLNRDETYEISMDYDKDILDKWMRIYTTGRGKKSVQLALERSGRYRDMILSVLKEYKLPEELVYLPIVESLFYNNTVSRAKAVGLWQIMANRGKALGLQINYWVDERRDPVKATRAAAKYLKELFILLNDWNLALSAYNRGEYGLIRDMKFSNASSVFEMKERNAVPKETQNYVPQFIVAAKIASDPEKYGFTDLQYQQPLQYDTVLIEKVMDLKVVAKCANTTVEEIKELNPSIMAWCTPHGYKNFELNLPYGSKETFLENIAKEKELNPSPGCVKHKVKNGEWTEQIASRYKTTVAAIKEDNPKIKKQKHLKPGQVLIIRPGRQYYK